MHGVENLHYVHNYLKPHINRPLSPRFMEPAVIVILGGVLPFGSIFIEM